VLSAYALAFGGLRLLGGRAADLLALPGRAPGREPLAALTQGYQSAFLACAVLAGIGLALALLLPGPPPKPAYEQPAPYPGGRCHCRKRPGDQVRNEMSEQPSDSYHPRRLRRR
jgi:MFS family permease